MAAVQIADGAPLQHNLYGVGCSATARRVQDAVVGVTPQATPHVLDSQPLNAK